MSRTRGVRLEPDLLVLMFIIELDYKVDLVKIDAHMKAHVEFLTKYYNAGNFLVSGRKIPRDGGIIIAVGASRAQIETIAKEDPFYTHGLADIRIVEFRASQRASDIQQRIDGDRSTGKTRPTRRSPSAR